MISLKLIDKDGNTVFFGRGEEKVDLAICREYQPGDMFWLECSDETGYLWLQVDDALGKSLIYYNGIVKYVIPFEQKRVNLSPKAFAGNIHLASVRVARDFEIEAYQNLALNVSDQHENATFFPHATANVETRGESVFAAQNAIDGNTANESHGKWPYESWGINRNKDAAMKLDFGREVEIDRIIVFLRADFPHDNWWKEMKITFSDGEELEMQLNKTLNGQELKIEPKKITWLEVSDLIQSDEKSPFPALSQIEVYGRNLR